MAEPFDERKARRQYVRRRQAVVFTILGCALAITLVISLLLFFHIIGSKPEASPAEKPNYGLVAPCPPADASGTPAQYLDNSKVTVRVLNGTKFSGLARAVGEALEIRNFNVTGITNYSSQKVERTTIYFGKNAINEAYTLNSDFTDAVLVMDDRPDTLVDVIIGASFNDLKTKKEVPGAGAKITGIVGCKQADAITQLPKAIEHNSGN